MTTLHKWIIGIVVLVVIVLVVFAVRKQPATAPTKTETNNEGIVKLDEPVRIGLMLPLTGDGAAYGINVQQAALMAQEEINAGEGIGGQQVEFIFEDSKCDPASGAASAQKLVSVDKVKIIFGGACSGETLAAAPITEEAEVLLISPSATSPDITYAGDYVFRTAPSDAGQGSIGAEYVFTAWGAKKAAILSEQTDYAQGLRKVFSTRFAELGGEVVADEVFQSKDTDVRAQILKIKTASPDVVYVVPQTPVSAVLLAKQLKAQEVSVQIFGSEVMLSRENIAKEPTLFEGMHAAEPYFDNNATDAASLLQRFEQKYGKKPDIPPAYVANMYSQLYLMKEGIEKVGLDTKTLKDWLYTIRGWKHALGELTFTPDGDAVGKYSVKEVQADGSLKELSVVRPQ